MSRDIDFTVSNLTRFDKIQRPSKPTERKKLETTANDNNPSKINKNQKQKVNYQISKSFTPNTTVPLNDEILLQVEELKKYAKNKLLKQQLKSQLIAEGQMVRKQDEVKQVKESQKIKDNIKVDEAGRIRDQQGNLVFIQNRATDLMINLKKQQEKDARDMGKKQKIKYNIRLGRGFFDRNLFLGSKSKRNKKMMLGLQFLEKGSYKSINFSNSSKPIQSLSEALQQEDLTTKIIKKRAAVKLTSRRDAPDIEWWDQTLLKDPKYPNFLLTDQEVPLVEYVNISELNNPVGYQRVGSQKPQQKISIPLYLTKDERKKLKRKRKQEKLQEKNDLIKLGLIKPDKVKLTVANMAIVMKDQFVMDPSHVEGLAKKQTQERLNKHLQANSSRKLSKSKRQEKSLRKLKRDSARQCRRVVFKLETLEDPTHIFKINMNAKQLALNGMVIKPSNYHRQPVLIAIEGGLKAVKFYKNLMMRRINWAQSGNKCVLVWQGAVQNTTLGKWKTFQVSDEPETIRLLTQKGIEHFWEYFINS